MIMRTLSSNQELYDYLQWLSAELVARGALDTAEQVSSAAHQASGPSTEFLGEVRIILRRISRSASPVLSEAQLADLNGIIAQLDRAFDSPHRSV
jgi:hypothetical protein